MKKKLWATVDYYDDVKRGNRHYSKEHLDGMMKYCASLGCERVQWILDTTWTLYDETPPGGFDLLEWACEAAHRHGLSFAVVFKPFEGALAGATGVLPEGLPIPDGAPVLREADGIVHAYRPFLGEHPEMNFARMTGRDEDPGGRLVALRLVKDDDAPSPFQPGDLSIWTSPRNGGYTKYEGPVAWSESSEWRLLMPPHDDRPRRIVTLGGLELPEATRFIMIRRERDGSAFANAVERLVELVNDRGEIIPGTPASRQVINAEKLFENFKAQVELGLTRFARQPAARALLEDRARFIALCEGMRSLRSGWEDFSFAQGGEFAVMRGKERRRTGVLHPAYPEVRQHWLDHIRYCVERNVDAVNIRQANHNGVFEPRYFGFNDPVVERMEHPGNFAEVRRINGDAYTLFLREAAELLHGAGKELGVHVHGLMLRHSDVSCNTSMVPLNVEWQWETWFKEIVDYAEYRGAFFFRPENQRYVADRIGFVAREANIPLVYQSMRGAMVHFDAPYPALDYEMDWVREHPDFTAYNLYEVAGFSRLDPDQGFVGSPDMAALVRRHGFAT